MLAWIFRGLFFVAQKIISELALLAAILSVVYGGSYWDRAIGGMVTVWQTIYGFTMAYIRNLSLSEVLSALGAGMQQAVESAGANIRANPQKVFYAILITYVSYKLAAYVLYVIRRTLLPRKPKEDLDNPGSGTKGKKKGQAYERLYGQKEEPRAPHRPVVD